MQLHPLSLKLFVAVVESGSIAGAAEQHHRSPTIARNIAVTSAERTPWPMTSQMRMPAHVSERLWTLKKSPPSCAAQK